MGLLNILEPLNILAMFKNVPHRNPSLPKVKATNSLYQLPLQLEHNHVTLNLPIRFSRGRLYLEASEDSVLLKVGIHSAQHPLCLLFVCSATVVLGLPMG